MKKKAKDKIKSEFVPCGYILSGKIDLSTET